MANVSELKQVTVALAAFAMKAAPAAPKAGTRKPMSEKAKQKIREAQLRRHQGSNAASTTD
jgi:hypothetical protein